MARSRSKKDIARQELLQLMSEPGEPDHIHADLLDTLSLDEAYDDRAAAIVFAALVEHSLERALATHFVTPPKRTAQLFSYPDEEGHIATFAAKITLGEAIGIYGEKMRRDLNWLKDIRNVFAHSRVNLSFETPAIRAACDLTTLGRTKAVHFRDLHVEVTTGRKKYAALATVLQFLLSYPDPRPLRLVDNASYLSFYANDEALP